MIILLIFMCARACRAFTGTAWLFLGVATTEGLLYHDDWMTMVRKFPFNFR